MRSRRIVGVLAAVVAAALLWPSPVLAHAALIRSDPPDLCPSREQAYLISPDPRCTGGAILAQPPQQVRLIFSEQVEPVGGGISVVGPDGQQVERGPAVATAGELSVAVDASEQGTYLVTWRVVSGDTHPAWGRFAFSVGKASPRMAADPGAAETITQAGLGLQTLGHWLHFAGYALAFGTLAFLLFVLSGAAVDAERRLWRLINRGIVVLLLAELPGLFGQMAGLGTGQFFDRDLLTALLTSSYGLVLAQRIGAALVLWVLLGVVGPGGPLGGTRWTAAGLLPGLALALIDGEASHAVGVQPQALGLVINAVHVAAMGAWLGGLAALLAVWGVAGLERRRLALARRFGALALAALALLIASGTLMAALHLNQIADLLNSGYGRALLAKLFVLALAVGLAGAGLYAGIKGRHRWWLLELAALAVVLLLAGLLVTLAPPL